MDKEERNIRAMEGILRLMEQIGNFLKDARVPVNFSQFLTSFLTEISNNKWLLKPE
jgi:hypothetical protein